MENSQALLHAENLGKDYEGTSVVSDYALTLQRGEILGLLGPNGAGKSTTLRMLSGTLAPSSGQILINDIDLLEHPGRAKQNLGYLPDMPPLYPDLTVREYLDFCALLRGIHKTQTRQAIDTALQRCSLDDVANRLIAQMSMGYRQRIGIAQAIIHEPHVIILDEPTVGLDPAQITAIRELIRSLAQDHAVLLSSHILSEVETVCTRVQIINAGCIVHEQALDQGRPLGMNFELFFAQPPACADIESVTGVVSALEHDPGFFRVELENDDEALAELTRQAVSQGWQMQEMTRSRESLEQVFMNKVFGETIST